MKDIAFSYTGTISLAFNAHAADPLFWSITAYAPNGLEPRWSVDVRNVSIETRMGTVYDPSNKGTNRPVAYLLAEATVYVFEDGTARIAPKET